MATNYAALAQNVGNGGVGDLESSVVTSTGGTTPRRADGDWKDSIRMAGEKASTAGRKIGNYFSEIPGKIGYKEDEDYNAFVIPLLLLAGTSITAGIGVGVALGAYAIYKTRCPALGMI